MVFPRQQQSALIPLNKPLVGAPDHVHSEVQREGKRRAANALGEIGVEGLEVDDVDERSPVAQRRAGLEFREALVPQKWPHLGSNELVDNLAIHLRTIIGWMRL